MVGAGLGRWWVPFHLPCCPFYLQVLDDEVYGGKAGAGQADRKLTAAIGLLDGVVSIAPG